MSAATADGGFYTDFAALGRRLRAEVKRGALVDLSPVVDLGRRLHLEEEADLIRFRDRVIRHPDRLLAYWIGRTALERRRLSQSQRAMLDVLGRSPDMLEPSKKRWDELSHTQSIAWFLARSPDLRTAFLSQVQRAIPHRMDRPEGKAFSPVTWRVVAERSVTGGRVDVWMESAETVILVEAKLGSSEGRDQVQRYNDARADHPVAHRWWVVVFLTVDPDQVPSGPALHMTFRDLLRAWLPVAVQPSFELREMLASYLASVARICGVGGPGDFDDWSPETRKGAIQLVRNT